MATYTIDATKRVYLRATIQAESLEEATRIADEDLIVEDFEEVGADFTTTFVGQEKK